VNLIFLTLARIENIEQRGIYSDLMRKFRDEGHQVYIVCPCERRLGMKTSLIESYGVHILNVKTLNIQKTNIVEKGIGTLLLEYQFKHAIKRYLKGIKFDLITYSTPPITFTDVVNYLKKQTPQAISYLQLKDIFPQNAVDIGMLSVSSLLYKYFRRKEIDLYKASDYIGCMSPANVRFVLDHNDYICADRVEVAPNSIELCNKKEPLAGQENAEKCYIRKKYGLPIDKPIFIYGGNLGRPQGIDFLIRCLNAIRNRLDCYLVIVGSGTEFEKVNNWYNHVKKSDTNNEMNVKVMHGLPKADYDMLVKYCDVGLIFLDHRFSIPNYPSRLLSYLENKMPIICATDINTDIGSIAQKNGYGFWCESKDPADFVVLVDKMLQSDIKRMGQKGYEFLCQHYLVEHTYKAIMSHLV